MRGLGATALPDVLAGLGPLDVTHARRSSVAHLDGLGQGPAANRSSPRLEVGGQPLVQLTPAPAEEHEARGAIRAEEGLAVDVPEERGIGTLRRLVEDGDGERVPEEPARDRALAVAAEIVGEAQARGFAAE